MVFKYPDFATLKQRRDQYSYPTVGLRGSVQERIEIGFSSVILMEAYHLELLTSAEPSTQVLGYLSVLYWGHYSGSKGSNPGRAAAKVTLAVNGMKSGQVETYASLIKRCSELLEEGSWGQALIRATRLPQMQAAFASKLCAFLKPLHCGVIDSVIAEKYPGLGFSLDKNGYVRTNQFNAVKYDEYCEGLKEVADQLNGESNNFCWTDRDGRPHSWRAVDVERALYG